MRNDHDMSAPLVAIEGDQEVGLRANPNVSRLNDVLYRLMPPHHICAVAAVLQGWVKMEMRNPDLTLCLVGRSARMKLVSSYNPWQNRVGAKSLDLVIHPSYLLPPRKKEKEQERGGGSTIMLLRTCLSCLDMVSCHSERHRSAIVRRSG